MESMHTEMDWSLNMLGLRYYYVGSLLDIASCLSAYIAHPSTKHGIISYLAM